MVAIRFPAQQSLGSVGRTQPATEAMLALVSFGLCSVLCAALVLFAAGGEGIFPFHPIFFAVGFLMCTLSAINVMQTKLAPVAKLPRQTKGLIHGTLQFLGFVFMVRRENSAFARPLPLHDGVVSRPNAFSHVSGS